MSAVKLIRDRSICTRRERRYTTSAEKLLRCEAAVEEGGLRMGHVIDLSSAGIRLLCDGQFRVGEQIHVQLYSDRSHGLYRGTVRRVEPWVDARTVLGCSLENKIPDSVLEELASEGIVNRRSDDRFRLSQQASISWQLSSCDVDVELTDYSYGGLRFESEIEVPLDTSVRLTIELPDEEVVLNGRTLWRTESENGYTAGIAFTEREAPATVEKIVQGADRSKSSGPNAGRSPRIVRGLAWATGIAAACYMLALM